MIKISPSILSADFANLAQEIHLLEAAGADMLHIDVMDGHFVPNLTIGPCVIKAMRPHTKLPFDVHLMIENPEKYISIFAEAGSDIITLHLEALQNPAQAIRQIKNLGIKCGLSLMPSTPAEILKDEVLKLLDVLLIMTVQPGFGGQQFMHNQLQKIETFAARIHNSALHTLLSVDGGINDATAQKSIEAGATMLVAGSFIFNKTHSYKDAIRKIRGAE